MATNVLESELLNEELEFNNELGPSNSDAEVTDDPVTLTSTHSGAQENVPTENGNGTLPSSNGTRDLNPEVSDSDSSAGVNTSLSNSSRLRKFVSSAKERFDNLEPGWAQRKTLPTEETSEVSGKQ